VDILGQGKSRGPFNGLEDSAGDGTGRMPQMAAASPMDFRLAERRKYIHAIYCLQLSAQLLDSLAIAANCQLH
jgi:hypothetical protein